MAKRLSKDDRREQLLSTAEEIVRTEGTDALTLITLAEKAGVTKALTYDHFSSREGLLVQLYRRYDEQVIVATQATIVSGKRTLECAAYAVADSYIACVSLCGPQYESVVSALLAYPDHQDIRFRIRDFFVEAYLEVFGGFLSGSEVNNRLNVIAIYGAIEEVARTLMAEGFGAQEAVEVLSAIIISILKGIK
ncbi:HTH-type transcriptional regulator BetI [compost metagenome]